MNRAQIEASEVARAVERLWRAYSAAVYDLRLDDFRAGLEWYRRAAETLCRLPEARAFPVESVLCAAAVLSPGNAWRVLVERFPAFLAEVASTPAGVEHLPTFPTYGANRRKAVAILQGHHGLGRVRGAKVEAFAQALLGFQNAVPIDRHAARIALATARAPTARDVRIATAAYRHVAHVAEHAPCALQALLWVAAVSPDGDVGGVRSKSGAGSLRHVVRAARKVVHA